MRSQPSPLATDPRRRSVTFVIVAIVAIVLLLAVVLTLHNRPKRAPSPLPLEGELRTAASIALLG